jgi:2-iminobutanoate/2-iminopropanoate deaminase
MSRPYMSRATRRSQQTSPAELEPRCVATAEHPQAAQATNDSYACGQSVTSALDYLWLKRRRDSPQFVSTHGAPATSAGTSSQALRYGDLVFVSGQLPVDLETGHRIEGGIAAQTEQVFRNLAAVLAAGGSDTSRLLRTTVYLQNRSDCRAMDEVYRRWVGTPPPARTVVEVGGLGLDSLIEVDAIAYI